MEQTARLPTIDLDGLTVHHSAGAEERARAIGARSARVAAWLRSVLDEAPEFDLHVVDQADWAVVGEGVPYGMPLAVPGKVVAPLDAAAWVVEHFRGLDGVPDELTAPLEMSAFVDTVVAHEVTHLTETFDERTWSSSLGPMWVSELYANLGMVGYLDTVEPTELGRVVRLARASRTTRADLWPVSDLERMPESLQHGLGNYVWFEMLLIVVALQIWERVGASALPAVRDALDGKGLTTPEIVAALDGLVPGVGEQLGLWPFV